MPAAVGTAYLSPEQAASLIAWLGRQAPDVMVSAARASTQVLMGLAIREGFENQGPRYLNRVTGTAIRSIPPSQGWGVSGKEITAWYGSNLPYVRAHEEGWQGPVRVRDHVRRSPWTGGAHFVRAHERMARIRARRMFGDSLGRHLDIPQRALDTAVRLVQMGTGGRVPTPAEVVRGLAG